MFPFLQIRYWFIVCVVKAFELYNDLQKYKREKEIARTRCCLDEEEPEVKSRAWKSVFCCLYCVVVHKVFAEGTIENFVLKSALGFLGGVLLTYICYLFLIYSLNFTLKRATLFCLGLGVVLSLGLAFSVRIRCTVLLCIPQLFSKRGRQALLAYAFILALSGPAKNTLHNVEVMSESLACGQEQLKKAENELMKCVHRPNTAAKQSLESLLVKLNFAVEHYKKFIEGLYKVGCAVIDTIIHTQEWLYSIFLLCNEKMGSPYGRCTDLLFEASQNCKGVSKGWGKICQIPQSCQDEICAVGNEPICSPGDLPPLRPFINRRKRLSDFRRQAFNMVYVKIHTQQVFMQPNRSTTLHEEYQGMATEIRQKTDQFLQYFDVMSVIFGIFILVLFIKVIIYRYKFLTEDEYDNRFITADFVDIDKTRAEFGMQTLLPLEPRERKKYIKVTSMRLVPYERTRLFSSFIFLIFATFKIIIHMLTDCSLYWMLATMRRHGRMLLVTRDTEHPQITISIEGVGVFAELLRNITKVVRPYAVQQILDPVPCLPDPISPDWNRYFQILTLVVICWFLAFCESYGLRLRHIVMVTYHPDRARERAIWLYNRILTTRINFVKFARRQLRRKYKDLDEKNFFRSPILRTKRHMQCLVCKEYLKCSKYVKCPTVCCVGIYCQPCFETLQLCSICKDPSSYGDFSDISEEKDSEEENLRDQCEKCSQRLKTEHRRTFCRENSFTEGVKVYQAYQTQNKFKSKVEKKPELQKFQISMDTIDYDDEYTNRETGRSEMLNEPEESPSVLTKLMNHWRKAFTSRTSREKSTEESSLQKCRCKYAESASWKTRKSESELLLPYQENEEFRKLSKPSEDGRRKVNKDFLKKEEHRKRKNAGKFKLDIGKRLMQEEEEQQQKNSVKTGKKKQFNVRNLFKWKLKERISEKKEDKKKSRESGKSRGRKSPTDLEKASSLKIEELFRRLDKSGMRSETPDFDSFHSPTYVHHGNKQRGRMADLDTDYSSLLKADYSSGMKQSISEKCDHCLLKELLILKDMDRQKSQGPCSGLQESSEGKATGGLQLSIPESWLQKCKTKLDEFQSRSFHKSDLEEAEKFCLQAALGLFSEGLTGPSQSDQCANQVSKESDNMFPLGSGKETTLEDFRLKCRHHTNQSTVENRDSSSVSSSDTSSACETIKKQLIDANRRRNKSRESMKTTKFGRRGRSASLKRRRQKKSSKRYETTSGSSDEAKHSRARRSKKRKRRRAMTADGSHKAVYKKVNVMKAKLAKFFRRSIKKQSSSDDGDSSGLELEEYNQMSALVSEEDSASKDRVCTRKSSQLSWAPDLISDLPSSKAGDGSPREVCGSMNAETEPENEDGR